MVVSSPLGSVTIIAMESGSIYSTRYEFPPTELAISPVIQIFVTR